MANLVFSYARVGALLLSSQHQVENLKSRSQMKGVGTVKPDDVGPGLVLQT